MRWGGPTVVTGPIAVSAADASRAVKVTLSSGRSVNIHSPSPRRRTRSGRAAATRGRSITMRSRVGSPARLVTVTRVVRPSRLTALTRNAPSARSVENVTSRQPPGTAGKTRIVPPQLCNSSS